MVVHIKEKEVELQANVNEIARLDHYEGILKKIVALKSSDSTMKKIHYNLQMESRKMQTASKQTHTNAAVQDLADTEMAAASTKKVG